MRNVVCMKWGEAFPADYVNRLYRGVMRNISQPSRFVCFTDNGSGLDAGIEVKPIPTINLPSEGLRPGPWRKLAIWSENIGLEGDVLFLDLDVVVTGSLDDLFDYAPGKLCIIRNWTQSDGTGNTSIFRFRAGSEPHLLKNFEKNPIRMSFHYDNEQIYVTRESRAEKAYWPQEWCPSFKFNLLPKWPANFWREAPLWPSTKIVVFTGHPRPHEAISGKWPAPLYKRLYKHVIAPSWLFDHWS